MARYSPGDKPLSEPMMVSWMTHLRVTRPQWIKMAIQILRNLLALPVLLLNSDMILQMNKQSILQISGDPAHWCIYAWPRHDKLKLLKIFVLDIFKLFAKLASTRKPRAPNHWSKQYILAIVSALSFSVKVIYVKPKIFMMTILSSLGPSERSHSDNLCHYKWWQIWYYGKSLFSTLVLNTWKFSQDFNVFIEDNAHQLHHCHHFLAKKIWCIVMVIPGLSDAKASY